MIAAYPHTSNWDGVIGVLTLWALGFPIHLWGKDSLFKIPVLAQILRSAGAVPIARTDSKGVVTQTVLAMHAQDVYWQGLAPEGTRKRLPGWRSGFYHLALAAGVPVALAYLDWSKKRIGVKHVVELSGDSDADMARIAACFEGVRGHTPALASPIRLLDAEFSRKDAVVKP